MAQSGSQTTAATIGKASALVLCAGAGCALAGPAGAAGGAAAGSILGGLIGSLAGNVAGNLATVFVERFTDFFGGTMSRATANAPNHDLAALAVHAVYDTIGAAIHVGLGKFADAAADSDHAAAWYRAQSRVNEYDLRRILRDRGRVLAAAGRWEEARAEIAESVALHERLFGAGHEWTATARRYRDDIGAGRVPEP